MLLRQTVTAVAVVALATTFEPALAQHSADQDIATPRVALAPVFDAHERLAARFRSLWGDATAARATVHDRVSFLRFLNAELLAQLDRLEVLVLPVVHRELSEQRIRALLARL